MIKVTIEVEDIKATVEQEEAQTAEDLAHLVRQAALGAGFQESTIDRYFGGA